MPGPLLRVSYAINHLILTNHLMQQILTIIIPILQIRKQAQINLLA